jgi:bifunctional UDP-N-acetylglucosamine pyrophosphorylase/glucosamine-1-phosphate N-acetyltransferase
MEFLKSSVKNLDSSNAQQELYLTDLVEVAAKSSTVVTVEVQEKEVTGVNTRVDLAKVDDLLNQQQVHDVMLSGVTVEKPESVTINSGVEIEADTFIAPLVRLLGNTSIGRNCIIEQGVVIENCTIGNDVTVKAYSVLENSKVEEGACIGPFAHLRPLSSVGQNAKVGNFVELKNTRLGKGSKANHLAYLGDGEVAENVNIGAGVIFCNYDGYLKHKTIIEKNVFIGSDSQLVAPVVVKENAYVASGSTVTMDVPVNDLAIARSRQVNKAGFAKKLKKSLEKEKSGNHQNQR